MSKTLSHLSNRIGEELSLGNELRVVGCGDSDGGDSNEDLQSYHGSFHRLDAVTSATLDAQNSNDHAASDRSFRETSAWTTSRDLDDIDREIQKLEEGRLILQQDIGSENWMKKRYQEQIEIAANQLKQIPPVDNARNSLTSSHATATPETVRRRQQLEAEATRIQREMFASLGTPEEIASRHQNNLKALRTFDVKIDLLRERKSHLERDRGNNGDSKVVTPTTAAATAAATSSSATNSSVASHHLLQANGLISHALNEGVTSPSGNNNLFRDPAVSAADAAVSPQRATISVVSPTSPRAMVVSDDPVPARSAPNHHHRHHHHHHSSQRQHHSHRPQNRNLGIMSDGGGLQGGGAAAGADGPPHSLGGPPANANLNQAHLINSASASSNNSVMSGNMFVSVNIGNVPSSSSHSSHPHSIMRSSSSSSSSKNNRVPSVTPASTFTPPPPPHQLQLQQHSQQQQHFGPMSAGAGSRDVPQLDQQLLSYGGFHGAWPPGKGQPVAALSHEGRDAAPFRQQQGFLQNAQLQSMFRQENGFHAGVVQQQGVGDTDSVMSFRSSNSGSETQNPRRLPSASGSGAPNVGMSNGMQHQQQQQQQQQQQHQLQQQQSTGFAGASGSKVEMVYSLLSMLGTHDKEDMSRTLFSMSSSQDSCIAMRQSGCLPLLIQLLHGNESEASLLGNTRGSKAARERAAAALHNIVHSHPDDKRGRREARVLRLLESIRAHCDQLRSEAEESLDVDQKNSNDGESRASEVRSSVNGGHLDHQPAPAVAALMKLSFDEEYRHAMCQLGGLQAIAELIQTDYDTFGHYPISQSIMTMSMTASTINDSDPQYHISLRRYAGMALTNLTFGDGTNKALLCSMKPCMAALVAQLESPSEELRQVTASVLRNLSWRADLASKKTLREIASVPILMQSAMQVKKESTLKAILSALWNLSAHCSENKADICRVQGALEFLVGTLTYKSPSKTLSIVENGGGILRNISSHIAVNEDYRKILRNHHCLHILLKHLKSESLTIVSNACGTLWNLSARCPEDQETLWSMGAVSMLKSLVHSKHKMISMGASAALKNLLQAKPNLNIMTSSFLGSSKRSGTNSLTSSTHSNGSLQGKDEAMPTLHVRKQKALEQELAANENLPETCPDSDNIENASPPARSAAAQVGHQFPNSNSLQCDPQQYNVLEFDQKRSLVRNFIQNQSHGGRISSKGNLTPPHQFFAGKEVESRDKSCDGGAGGFQRSDSAASVTASAKSDASFERRKADNNEILSDSHLAAEPVAKEKKKAFPVVESPTILAQVLDDVVNLGSDEPDDAKALSVEPEIVKKYSAYTESEIEESEDQPTNFSLRYNEEEDEEESGNVKEQITNSEDNYQAGCNEDAVKMYCTEDTPLNFSVATSLTDLTSAGVSKEPAKNAPVEKLPMASPQAVQKNSEEMVAPSQKSKEEALASNLKEKREGPASVTSDSDKAERTQSVLSFQSGGLSASLPSGAIEKPSNYCVEGTPTCFSRVSSLSSLHSCEAEDRGGNEYKPALSKSCIPEETTELEDYKCPKSLKKEQTPPAPPKRTGSSISDIVNPSTGETVILEDAVVLGTDEKIEQSSLASPSGEPLNSSALTTSMKPKPSADPRASSSGKTVSFSEGTISTQQTPNQKQPDNVVDTPLMFSRCSSVGSLSSMVDPNSVHDDRGSVVSDYSRLTSRAVSPSELPDSPSESMPSSPKRTRSPVSGLKSSKTPPGKSKILPSESVTKAVVERQLEEINQTEKLVPDDSTRSFWTEDTPAVSGGCSRDFSETSSLLSALTINDGDDGEKAKLTKNPTSVNPQPTSRIVNATDVSAGKGGQVSLITAAKTEATAVADHCKSVSSAKSQTSSSLTSMSSGSKSVVSVKANDKSPHPPAQQETKNDESDISEGEEDLLEAMIQAAKPTSSKRDARDKNPKHAKMAANRRFGAGTNQSKPGKAAAGRVQLEKQPPRSVTTASKSEISKMPIPMATRARHLPGNKNSTGPSPSASSIASSPAMSTLNDDIGKPPVIPEETPKTYQTEGTPKTQFSTATSLSDLTIDDDEKAPIDKALEVSKNEEGVKVNEVSSALSDTSSLSDDESALMECIKSAMPTKSVSKNSNHGKIAETHRGNHKVPSASKAGVNQPRSKSLTSTTVAAKNNFATTRPSPQDCPANADSVKLFASEGTPGLSHASSLSELTIDSTSHDSRKPTELKKPELQSPFESVSESPRIFSGIEGTPAVFSRNDSLSSLSCEEDAEDLGIGKLSIHGSKDKSLRHSSFSPSRPDQKNSAKLLPRPKTSPGLSSPAGSESGSHSNSQVNNHLRSPTGIPRLAHRRSRTPSVERVKILQPIPPMHGVPSPGIHSPRAFAVEGTPVCFSRNSSLSSLSLEEEEESAKAPSPKKDAKQPDVVKDDTMEEGEEALLDELVSAGLPKGKSHKKIPGSLLSKGGKKNNATAASGRTISSMPSKVAGGISGKSGNLASDKKKSPVGPGEDQRTFSGSPMGRRTETGVLKEIKKPLRRQPIENKKAEAKSEVDDDNFSVISFIHKPEEEKPLTQVPLADGECLDDIELPSIANELGDSLSSSAGMSLSMNSEKGGKDLPEKMMRRKIEDRAPQAETPEEGRWEVTFSGGWVAPDGEKEGSVPKTAKPVGNALRKPSIRDQAYESPAVTTEERRKLKKEELLASLSAEVKLRRQQKLASQKSEENVNPPQEIQETSGEPSIAAAAAPEVSRNAPKLNDETYLISKPCQDDSLNTDVSAIMSSNDQAVISNDSVTNLSPEQQSLVMEEANMVACNIRQSTESKMEELMLEFNDMLEKGEGIDNETMSIFSMTESTEDQTSSQGSNKLSVLSLDSPTEPPTRSRIVKPTELKTTSEEASKVVRGRRKPLYPGSSVKPVSSEEQPTVAIRGGGNKVAGQANPKTQKQQQQREGTVIKVPPLAKSNPPVSSKSSGSQSRSNTFTRPDSSSSNSESSPTPSPENNGASSKDDTIRPPGPVRQSTFTKDSPSDSEMNVPLISPSQNSPAPSPSKSSGRLKTQSPSPSPAARGSSASARLHTAPTKKTEAKPTTSSSQSSSHIRPRTATPTSSLNVRNRSASRASLASNSSVSTASVRGSTSSIASGTSGAKKAASTSNLMTHRVSPRDKATDAPQHQYARAKSASSGVLNNPKLSLSPRARNTSVRTEPAKGPSKKTAVVSKIASLWKKEKKTEPEGKSGKPVEHTGESAMTKSSTYEKLEQSSPENKGGNDKKKQGTFTKEEASKMKAETASGLSSIGGWAKKKADKNATSLQKGKGNAKSSFYVTLEESAQNEEPQKKSPSTSNGSSDGASEALQDIWVKRVHTAINLNECDENNKTPDDYPQSSQESDAGSVKSASRSGTKTPTLERLNSFVKHDHWSGANENKKAADQQSMASSRATSPQPTQAPPGRTNSAATLSSFGSRSRTSSSSLQRSPTSESIMAAASTAVQIVTPFNWNPPASGVSGEGQAEGGTADASGARGAEGSKKSTCLITTV